MQKKKMASCGIGIFILLSLFFHAAHALIIHTEEQCIHETVTEFDHGSDCGDLCEVHHFFHIPAIPVTSLPVCSCGVIPLAAAIQKEGASRGAAFVFLSAGPATNTVTMGVVKKMLGAKALAIYLATITVGSILFGLLIDLLFGSMQIDPRSVVHVEEEVGLIAALSSIALWILILKNFIPAWMRKKSNCCNGGSCCGN